MAFEKLNIVKEFGSDGPFIIAGPCSAESREQVLATARELSAIGIKIFRAGVWKPRTKPGGFEGVGTPALEWLSDVKRETGMLPAVEVANASHLRQALAAGIEIIWIGARSSANPFVVQEIANAIEQESNALLHNREITVLIKNPINPDSELWIGAIERIALAGVTQIGAIHRGFSSYQKGLMRNTPHWSIPIELKRRMPGLTLLCDPSHIGGKRELISPIAKSAIEMGFDGLIIESHVNPDLALSDKEQQITPKELNSIISTLKPRQKEQFSDTALDLFRREIDEIDQNILELLSKRMSVSREIGRYKLANDVPIIQPIRYDDIITCRTSRSQELMLNSEFIRILLEVIHEESVKQQLEATTISTNNKLDNYDK